MAIDTPSTTYLQASDEFILHRAVLQSGFSGSPGLIQAGVYRSGSGIQLDNCGVQTSYIEYDETLPYGSTNGYVCHLYSHVTQGVIHTYDIFRHTPAANWGIYIDGNDIGRTYTLGFNTGYAAIGSEIQDVNTDWTTEAATQFGPSGFMQWSYYTTVLRTNPHIVDSGDVTATYLPRDGFWCVPSQPTPMTIKHRKGCP